MRNKIKFFGKHVSLFLLSHVVQKKEDEEGRPAFFMFMY